MLGTKSLQGTRLSVGIASCAGCAFMLFGYDQGVFGSILGSDNFVRTFNHPNAVVEGQITATYDLGCFFGALAGMYFGATLGRVRALYWGCSILIVGAILQTSAFSIAQMIVGRFVAGVGNGLNTCIVPVWLSETSKPGIRGRLITLTLVLNQVGNVQAQWLNFGMDYISNRAVSWRFPLAYQIFFALLTMVMLPWLVESPRWLVQKDRHEEARTVISRLLAKEEGSQEVETFYRNIAEAMKHENEESGRPWHILLQSDNLHSRRRVLLGAGTQFMQQWGGINVINYYLPIVFGSLGVSRRLALVLSGCNVINLMFSSVVGGLFIDRYGRVPLMFWGALVQALCFAFVGIGLSQGGFEWSAVAVAFVFGYFTTFGVTWIAVPWAYPAEVNTQRMRTTGAAIATATNWINNYVVVLITPVAVQNIKWGFYILFAALNLCFAPIVWFFYVETKNVTLEAIDAIFEQQSGHSPVARFSPENHVHGEKVGAGDVSMVEKVGGTTPTGESA